MAWFMALSTGRKFLVGGGMLIALILAIALLVKVVSSRDERLKQAGRDETQVQWDAERAGRASVAAEFQKDLLAQLQPRFDQLASSISGIDTSAAEINVRLPQAIAAAPRYIDPKCDLTPDVRSEVNAARALSARPEPVR